LFIFFTCLKKTNQKKGQPFTWSRKRDSPALLKITGRCETRRLQRLRQSSRYSGYFFTARLREMAFKKCPYKLTQLFVFGAPFF
jgi:hypothetical protein